MHGGDEVLVDLRFSSSNDEVMELCFEPVGTTFRLNRNDVIYLRMPISAVPNLEVVMWPNGIGVWVAPYPGEYIILDGNKVELDRL